MNQESIFTKIIERKIPAEIIKETENIIVIKDISPQAPIHLLIIPKKPFINIATAQPEDFEILKQMLLTAQELSQTLDNAQEFKVLMNNGYKAGQRVFHAHMHFMAGF